MTGFPDDQYAHCPFCGQHEGMGLSSEGRGRGFVVCFCGARGPHVSRSDFTQDGVFDLAGFDAALRRAWNTRGASDGRYELEAKLADVADRMKWHTDNGREPPAGMFAEQKMWQGHLARLGDSAATEQS